MLMFMFYLIWLFNAILFRLYEPYAYLRDIKSRPMIFVGIAFVVMLIFLVIKKYEKTIGIYLIFSGALLAVCVVYMATLIPDRKNIEVYCYQRLQASGTYEENYREDGKTYIRHKVVYEAMLTDGNLVSFETSYYGKYDKTMTVTVIAANGDYMVVPMVISRKFLNSMLEYGDYVVLLAAGAEVLLGIWAIVKNNYRKEEEINNGR